MSRIETIAIPDIGDFKDVPVIDIMVKPGDEVAIDDTLVVLESDKATLDVPASMAGRVRDILVAPGDRVSQGAPLLVLEIEDGEEVVPATAPAPPEGLAPTEPSPDAPEHEAERSAPPEIRQRADATATADARSDGPSHAPPSVRRFARQLGVDLAQVRGTGIKGRISKDDVCALVKERLASSGPATIPSSGGGLDLLPWPRIDFAKFGPVERAPLSKIRRISGANLSRNAVVIPHVTNFDEADITDLEAFRVQLNQENARNGQKLTILPFIIKAAVFALRKYPAFNSSLDGEELVLKRYYNIGFAADTPDGLVVPVIKDADRKGIVEIAQEAVHLAAEAREGRLKLADMQGATFTISSLGGVGGTNFTPIVNAPEVAILGMTRAQMKPVWDGEAFQPRLVQPLSLSWDHRVVDGVAAAKFLVAMCQVLGDFRRILL